MTETLRFLQEIEQKLDKIKAQGKHPPKALQAIYGMARCIRHMDTAKTPAAQARWEKLYQKHRKTFASHGGRIRVVPPEAK